MFQGKKPVVCLLLAATALVTPQIAMAAAAAPSAREAALTDRLSKLEAELAQLRADLGAAKTQQADTAKTAQAADAHATTAAQVAQTAAKEAKDTSTRVAAVEKKAAPDGFRSGATTIKIGGFLKLQAASSHTDNGTVATNTLGRDFYLPQSSIPVGGGRSQTTTDFSAKQTRLWLNLDTQVAGHTVRGYLETDFQTTASPAQSVTGGGSQRTTNGYTLALRRAFVTLDKWTFGQDWTTFQYTGALPESTDFLGATEGTVFVRQPLVRYSTPLSKAVTLHVSAENPESATANAGTPTLIENGTDRLPDFAARLVVTGKKSELSVAALGRQVRTEVTGLGVTTTGFGGSVGGKLFLNNAKSSDLRFLATYGQNISRYVGVNFAPDAVYVASTNSLANVNVFAALAAARVAITPSVRVNLIGSYQSVDYDSALAPATIAAFNKSSWSGAANLFYSPVRAIDLGIEYRHGTRELVSGAKGSLDRIEFAAKYNF